jgi:predicted enzyme related to lactoylglutathione lyase
MPDKINPETMFLSTQDIEAAYKEIKSKGVEPSSDIMPYPTRARFFSVNDPYGDFLHILQS